MDAFRSGKTSAAVDEVTVPKHCGFSGFTPAKNKPPPYHEGGLSRGLWDMEIRKAR